MSCLVTRDRELPLKRHMPALEESVRNPISMRQNNGAVTYRLLCWNMQGWSIIFEWANSVQKGGSKNFFSNWIGQKPLTYDVLAVFRLKHHHFSLWRQTQTTFIVCCVSCELESYCSLIGGEACHLIAFCAPICSSAVRLLFKRFGLKCTFYVNTLSHLITISKQADFCAIIGSWLLLKIDNHD